MLLHTGESPLLVIPLACRLKEMLEETAYYFTKGVVLMSLNSLKTCCFHPYFYPTLTQNYFHFYSVKVQSWLHARKDANIFPRSFLLQNWQKQKRNANERADTEMSPKVSDLLSWNQSKKSFSEGEGYSWQPTADSMAWTVSRYRRNQGLKHVYNLSIAYTRVQRCGSVAVGTETLSKHPHILWETVEEKP